MSDEYAKSELTRAGIFDKDADYGGMLGGAVMELIEVFNKQGHSGGSAPMVVSMFSKLAMHEPLMGITGEDDEWMDVCDDGSTFQNKRLSNVFKEGKDGRPYFLDAIIWRTEKSSYAGSAQSGDQTIRSRQFIRSFPFTPKTFYIDVDEHEVAPDDWEFTVKDPSQLKPVFEYYA